MLLSDIRAKLDDPARLAALYETGMLDAISEPAFDKLTKLASRLLGSPIVIITLVDSARDFVLSDTGLPDGLLKARDIVAFPTFCQYAVATGAPFDVEDARVDPEFANYPAVAHQGVVSCANAPLVTAAGHAIGNLCVVGFEARVWTDEDREVIATLAGTAVQDIELRLRTRESERARSEVKLVLERIPEALFVLDNDRRFTFVNHKAEELLSIDGDSLLGREFRDALPLMAGLVDDALIRCAESGVPEGFEMYIEPYQRWFDLQLDPSDTGLSVYMRDVTARKQIEEQMRQSMKMEAVGQLASGIAHDFNNLLTVISSCGEMLIEDLPANGSSSADAEQIMGAARRAATLTKQLLVFSRRQALKLEIVDINAVASNMYSMLRRIVRQDIEIVTSLDPALHSAYTDAGQIEQVIMNLVVNARDALPDGGRVTITTANADMGSCAQPCEIPNGTGIRISVADNGVGMSASVLDRIFEPFFTTKEVGKGTGLGLATVYGIVTQAGGHISCSSAPGMGTTFTMHLPAYRGDSEVGVAQPPDARRHRGGEFILLVEDETVVRKAMTRMLRRSGYFVLEAASGEDALTLLKHGGASIDLMITDLVMPQMSGGELALRARTLMPQLPLMFVSGHTEEGMSHRSFLTTSDCFLEKPFLIEQLTAKVREALAAT